MDLVRNATKKPARGTALLASRDRSSDGCHLTHRGMGGNPKGDRTTRDQIITLCRVCHGHFDLGHLGVEPLTPRGTDDICAFSERSESGAMTCFAIEKRIGVSITRTPV